MIFKSLNPKAIVLLSGGIDSSTTLAIAKKEGFAVYALTVSYGQRHKVELDAAKNVANFLGVQEHKFLNLDIGAFGGSALTSEIDVPESSWEGDNQDIPITYVPARNTVLLSVALCWAEVIGAENIFIGATYVDYSGYPDCRPEFLKAFEHLANLATKAGVEGAEFKINAPLLYLRKSEIIRIGVDSGLDYSLTHSCYDPAPQGHACGKCDSCIIRKRGFAEAGIPDPTRYIQQKENE